MSHYHIPEGIENGSVSIYSCEQWVFCTVWCRDDMIGLLSAEPYPVSSLTRELEREREGGREGGTRAVYSALTSSS